MSASPCSTCRDGRSRVLSTESPRRDDFRLRWTQRTLRRGSISLACGLQDKRSSAGLSSYTDCQAVRWGLVPDSVRRGQLNTEHGCTVSRLGCLLWIPIGCLDATLLARPARYTRRILELPPTRRANQELPKRPSGRSGPAGTLAESSNCPLHPGSNPGAASNLFFPPLPVGVERDPRPRSRARSCAGPQRPQPAERRDHAPRAELIPAPPGLASTALGHAGTGVFPPVPRSGHCLTATHESHALKAVPRLQVSGCVRMRSPVRRRVP